MEIGTFVDIGELAEQALCASTKAKPQERNDMPRLCDEHAPHAWKNSLISRGDAPVRRVSRRQRCVASRPFEVGASRFAWS